MPRVSRANGMGVVGLVAGLGWPAGAVIVDFAVIVPFAALTWLSAIALGVVVWRRGARGPGTTCSAAPHR